MHICDWVVFFFKKNMYEIRTTDFHLHVCYKSIFIIESTSKV